MRYLGGKGRYAMWIMANIVPISCGRKSYLEPFIGSGAAFEYNAPRFKHVTIADSHPDLIMMWKALCTGWVPPERCTFKEYRELQYSPPSALRGFVGFAASLYGMWFGGYVTDPRRVLLARQAICRIAQKMCNASASIVHADYKQHVGHPDLLIYCDPPYKNTLGYNGVDDFFISSEFWKKADEWVEQGAIVVVSESHAPMGWTLIASQMRKSSIGYRTVMHEGIYAKGFANAK